MTSARPRHLEGPAALDRDTRPAPAVGPSRGGIDGGRARVTAAPGIMEQGTRLQPAPGPKRSAGGENGDEPLKGLVLTEKQIPGQAAQSTPGSGLVEALCEARKQINEVEKSGYNENRGFAYATYDDVMRAVAKPMAEAGLWCFESVVWTRRWKEGSSKKGNTRWRVGMLLETVWTDGDSEIRTYWTGETVDTGDKQHYQLLSQITKYAYAKTLKLETGDPDVDDPTRSSSTGKSRPATEKQLNFIDDLQDRCQAAGADPDDWPEMQRRAKGFQAASRQIDALLAIEEAYKEASGEEAKQLAAAGVEEARNGGGAV